MPDTTGGRWQPEAWDASGTRIPVITLAGAGLNEDLPPAKLYPFWQFVPTEGRVPPKTGPVANWLETKGPDPFPVSGIYSWSNLRMGFVTIDGTLGGWHSIPRHMMPLTSSLLLLDDPSFWLRGPFVNGGAPLYRMELPSMAIRNLGTYGPIFHGANSKDFIASKGALVTADYYDEDGEVHSLEITAAFARTLGSKIHVLGWKPETTVTDGAEEAGRLRYDVYNLRGKLLESTDTELLGYPLGIEIDDSGVLAAVIRELRDDADGSKSVIENTLRESIIRIEPGHAARRQVLASGWAPYELLDYAYDRAVVKSDDKILVLDAGSLQEVSRFDIPWKAFRREPGLIHAAHMAGPSEIVVATYGRRGKPADPSERLQLVALLNLRGEPLAEFGDGPGLRDPEPPWAYFTNRPNLMCLGDGLLANVTDGVGMVLYVMP